MGSMGMQPPWPLLKTGGVLDFFPLFIEGVAGGGFCLGLEAVNLTI